MMSKNQNRKNHFSDRVQEAKSYLDNFSEEKAVDSLKVSLYEMKSGFSFVSGCLCPKLYTTCM